MTHMLTGASKSMEIPKHFLIIDPDNALGNESFSF